MRLLIVDDDPATRFMLRMVVEPFWEVVGEAENGLDAIEACKRLCPNVILLDISMPTMDGLEAAEHLKKNHPAAHIIFVSSFNHASYAEKAFRAGGEGYVSKHSAPIELPEAVREVLAGRTFQSNLVAN